MIQTALQFTAALGNQPGIWQGYNKKIFFIELAEEIYIER